MQYELAFPGDCRWKNESVTSVMATSKANDKVRLSGEVVDDFALAFVTPEDAYDTGCGHGSAQRKRAASIPACPWNTTYG